jgi:hypothetical protein
VRDAFVVAVLKDLISADLDGSTDLVVTAQEDLTAELYTESGKAEQAHLAVESYAGFLGLATYFALLLRQWVRW